MNKINSFIKLFTVAVLLLSVASCADFMDSDTNSYLSSDEQQINSPNDTVYSILGILTKVHQLVGKNVLVGEVRADMMDVTDNTSEEIRALNNFSVNATTSTFANVKDYYSVINNCNYFIQKADTSITVRQQNIFKREVDVAKAIRAWTYLQLGMNYGKVVYYTEPILSVADMQKDYPELTPEQLIDVLIAEILSIEPTKDTPLPQYGNIDGVASQYLFINPLFVLGDLYLWKASFTHNNFDYESAATYYAKLIEMKKLTTWTNSVYWRSVTFTDYGNNWSELLINTNNGSELISAAKLASSSYEGTMNDIEVLCSNYKLKASSVYNTLSSEQTYCYYYQDPATKVVTLKYTTGDLRKKAVLNTQVIDNYSNESFDIIKKFEDNVFPIYRTGLLYLRYAEAVNRLGKPSLAFAALKYGLNITTLTSPGKVQSYELADLKPYFQFFLSGGTDYKENVGIHSRGSGNSTYNAFYMIPNYTRFMDDGSGVQVVTTDPTELANAKSDSIQFVENLLCDELALETTFEGNRFHDLMRISNHRNDPTFLAQKVAKKHGDNYSYYFDLLSNKKNWYLPTR